MLHAIARGFDLARAAAARHGPLRRAERRGRDDLLALQTKRLERLLETAWARSAFYRRRWGRHPPRAGDFPSLEPLTKADIIDHYDSILTDRSLRRELLGPLADSTRRSPWIVLRTSGTTGEPVEIPYSRREWIAGLAAALRGESRRSRSVLQSLRKARRMAFVMTRNRAHASTRLNDSMRLPPLRMLQLAAGLDLEEQIRKLERFRPTLLSGYPTAIDRLARAQLERRLAVRPIAVMVGGETVPLGLRERVREAWGVEVFDCYASLGCASCHAMGREAWGVEVFDCYGLTETLVIAWECREHRGMHIDEDVAILEVVDQGRVVPQGESGTSVLATNLYNYTFPIIRYEIDDVMAIEDTPCPCGAPFARIVSVEGRRGEMLRLRGQEEPRVTVHPTVVEVPLEAAPSVRRYQIREDDGELRVLVETAIPRGGAAGAALRARLETALRSALENVNVDPRALRLEIVEKIEHERGPSDKARRILRDRDGPPGGGADGADRDRDRGDRGIG